MSIAMLVLFSYAENLSRHIRNRKSGFDVVTT